MFEKTVYQCPKCHAVIRQEIEDEAEVDCLSCGKLYRVMLDKGSGKVGFIEVAVKEIPETRSPGMVFLEGTQEACRCVPE